MPLTLSQVRKKASPFTARIGEGEEIIGEYNTRAYTPEYVARIRGMDNDDPLAWAKFLSPLLVSWDLVFGKEDADAGLCSKGDVGKQYPTDADSLAKLPIEVLSAVVTGIQEGARPNPQSDGKPESSSLRADEEGPVLTSIN